MGLGESAGSRAYRHSRRRGPALAYLVSMKKGWLSTGVGAWVFGVLGSVWWWSDAHLSMACSSAGLGVMGGRLRGLKSKRAVRRPDEEWSLRQMG